MALMDNTKRNLQRRLEAANKLEGWADCRRGGGFESRSSHPFSKGAAFGS